MGKTETGPVRIEPVEIGHPVPFEDGYPTVVDHYNTATKFRFKVDYAEGPELWISSDTRNGVLIEGSDGKIFVNRGGVSGKAVDELKDNPLPAELQEMVEDGRPEDPALASDDSAVHVYNFFEAMEQRKLPHSDVFSHHRALSTCHLAAISGRLGRVLNWDPQAEKVVDDPQAEKLIDRPKREGFEIKS